MPVSGAEGRWLNVQWPSNLLEFENDFYVTADSRFTFLQVGVTGLQSLEHVCSPLSTPFTHNKTNSFMEINIKPLIKFVGLECMFFFSPSLG